MEKKSNELYVYTVYNKISKKYNGLFYHYTDEEMIQKSLPIILMDYCLRDIEIKRIAIFNDDTSVITYIPECSNVDVMCYTFPHSRLSPEGEDLSVDEIQKSMQNKKNQILAETKTIENKSEDKEGK